MEYQKHRQKFNHGYNAKMLKKQCRYQCNVNIEHACYFNKIQFT